MVNVNYRYTEDELVYLLDYTDTELLVYDAQFSDRVAAIRSRLPKLRRLVEIDDRSGSKFAEGDCIESLIAAYPPLGRQPYAETDLHMLCTGGTTGMPKGVLYEQGVYTHSLFNGFALAGQAPCRTRAEVIDAIRSKWDEQSAPVSLPACPLMHGTGFALGIVATHAIGGCVVPFANDGFDAHHIWNAVSVNQVTDIIIVGDAFARPMVDALGQAAGRSEPYALPSLQRIHSSGVMFSREMKAALLDHLDVTIMDLAGATEGSMAASITSRSAPPVDTGNFMPSPTTKVFGKDDREILPGSDEIGMIATTGLVPVGYYKDELKSAATFRMVNGIRYSFPGDFAKIATNGSLIFLGRGSNCINTGGEKVFAEEVEEALKSHPHIADSIVVGIPDERFGQRIVAIIAGDGKAVGEAELADFCRQSLSGYKIPRKVIWVPQVQRGPNGKPDYGWARQIAAR